MYDFLYVLGFLPKCYYAEHMFLALLSEKNRGFEIEKPMYEQKLSHSAAEFLLHLPVVIIIVIVIVTENEAIVFSFQGHFTGDNSDYSDIRLHFADFQKQKQK